MSLQSLPDGVLLLILRNFHRAELRIIMRCSHRLHALSVEAGRSAPPTFRREIVAARGKPAKRLYRIEHDNAPSKSPTALLLPNASSRSPLLDEIRASAGIPLNPLVRRTIRPHMSPQDAFIRSAMLNELRNTLRQRSIEASPSLVVVNNEVSFREESLPRIELSLNVENNIRDKRSRRSFADGIRRVGRQVLGLFRRLKFAPSV
mmetsp:Transcript_32300/g.52185  ORF Transcript_32300/g.52185 Transcript_32300/m.52185 type:complete len:205 (+) Transcript_32300:148-762(+)